MITKILEDLIPMVINSQYTLALGILRDLHELLIDNFLFDKKYQSVWRELEASLEEMIPNEELLDIMRCEQYGSIIGSEEFCYNDSKYDEFLCRGIIGLYSNSFDNYDIISLAIVVKKTDELPYYLRSFSRDFIIPSGTVLFDIKSAMKLAPTCRNFYRLSSYYLHSYAGIPLYINSDISKSILDPKILFKPIDISRAAYGTKFNASQEEALIIEDRRRGFPESAAYYLDKAIELNDQSSELLIFAGILNLILSNDEASKKLFERCLEINPFAPNALAGLWWIANNEGNNTDALKYSKMGVENTSFACFDFFLGVTFKCLKKFDESLFYLSKYQDFDPLCKIAIKEVNTVKHQKEQYMRGNLIEDLQTYISNREFGKFDEAIKLFYAKGWDFKSFETPLLMEQIILSVDGNFDFTSENQHYRRFKDAYIANHGDGDYEMNPGYPLHIFNDSARFHLYNLANTTPKQLAQNDINALIDTLINQDTFVIEGSCLLLPGIFENANLIEAMKVNYVKCLFKKNIDNERIVDDNNMGSYINDDSDEYVEDEGERDTFNALTDGQEGDFEDFDGDIDNLRTGLGLD